MYLHIAKIAKKNPKEWVLSLTLRPTFLDTLYADEQLKGDKLIRILFL